jgi:hypothetical protein
MRHKCWEGDSESVWGGEDATDEDAQNAWKEFLLQCEGNIPDFLRHEIEQFQQLDAREQDQLRMGSDNQEMEPAVVDGQDDLMNAAGCQEFGFNDAFDPSTVGIEWDRNYGTMFRAQSYDGEKAPVANVLERWEEIMGMQKEETAIEEQEQSLRGMQIPARRIILHPNCDSKMEGKLSLLLGKGGTGKSTTINAVRYEIETRYGVRLVKLFATTDRAASGMLARPFTVPDRDLLYQLDKDCTEMKRERIGGQAESVSKRQGYLH